MSSSHYSEIHRGYNLVLTSSILYYNISRTGYGLLYIHTSESCPGLYSIDTVKCKRRYIQMWQLYTIYTVGMMCTLVDFFFLLSVSLAKKKIINEQSDLVISFTSLSFIGIIVHCPRTQTQICIKVHWINFLPINYSQGNCSFIWGKQWLGKCCPPVN